MKNLTCFNLYTIKLTLPPKKRKFKSGPAQIPPQPNLVKGLKELILSKILCTDGVEMKVCGKTIHFAFIINPATRYIVCYNYSYKERLITQTKDLFSILRFQNSKILLT